MIHPVKVAIHQLTTLRLVCARQGCGTALEIAPVRAASMTDLRCPGCGGLYQPGEDGGERSHLHSLCEALEGLRTPNGPCKVEFIISLAG